MSNLFGIWVLVLFNALFYAFYREFSNHNIKLSWTTLGLYFATSISSLSYALFYNPLIALIYVFPFYIALFHLYAKVFDKKIRLETRKERSKWKLFSNR